AIEKIAFANNLKVVKTSDEFYVIKPLEEGEEILVQDENKKVDSPFENPFPRMDQSKVKKPQSTGDIFVDVKADSLNNPLVSVEAVNAPISETIRTVAAAAGVSYFLFSEIKGNSTVRILNVVFDDFLKKLLQGTEYTYK